MYALEQMLDLANQKWKSKIHKQVAVTLLICNPGVRSRNQLIELGGKINSLSSNEVKTLTIEGAVRMGVPFN